MEKTLKMFAALRQDKYDGHKWLDTNTLSTLAEIAKSKADSMDNEIPRWASVNMQVAVIELTITYEE